MTTMTSVHIHIMDGNLIVHIIGKNVQNVKKKHLRQYIHLVVVNVQYVVIEKVHQAVHQVVEVAQVVLQLKGLLK